MGGNGSKQPSFLPLTVPGISAVAPHPSSALCLPAAVGFLLSPFPTMGMPQGGFFLYDFRIRSHCMARGQSKELLVASLYFHLYSGT